MKYESSQNKTHTERQKWTETIKDTNHPLFKYCSFDNLPLVLDGLELGWYWLTMLLQELLGPKVAEDLLSLEAAGLLCSSGLLSSTGEGQ